MEDLIKIIKNEISMRYAVFNKKPDVQKKKVEEMEKVKKFLEGLKMVAEGVVGQEDIGGKLNVGDYLEHDIIFKILEYDGKKVRIWIEAIDE